MTTTSFDEFMQIVDWDDLDINEQKGLFDAIESAQPIDLGMFKLLPANNSEENLILRYVATGDDLVLTPKAKKYLKRWLEKKYTKGEDGLSYLDWKQQIEKED